MNDGDVSVSAVVVRYEIQVQLGGRIAVRVEAFVWYHDALSSKIELVSTMIPQVSGSALTILRLQNSGPVRSRFRVLVCLREPLPHVVVVSAQARLDLSLFRSQLAA